MASPIHKHSANDSIKGKKEEKPKEGHGGENSKTEVKASQKDGVHEGDEKDVHERHRSERDEAHKRHESESKDHHNNHHVATRKMHARHQQELNELNQRHMSELGGPPGGAAPGGVEAGAADLASQGGAIAQGAPAPITAPAQGGGVQPPAAA